MAKALRTTSRRQFGSPTAPSVGPNIEAGQTFIVTWRHPATDDRDYVLTPFWTRVDPADVELVG